MPNPRAAQASAAQIDLDIAVGPTSMIFKQMPSDWGAFWT